MMLNKWQRVDTLRWDQFTDYVDKNYIEVIIVRETEITGKFNTQGIAERRQQDNKASESFSVDYNPGWIGEQYLNKLKESGIEVKFARQRI